MRWGIIAALVLWCGVGLAQTPSGEAVEEYKRDFEHAQAAYQKAIDDAKEQLRNSVIEAKDKVVVDFKSQIESKKKEVGSTLTTAQISEVLAAVKQIEQQQQAWEDAQKMKMSLVLSDSAMRHIVELLNETKTESLIVKDVIDSLFKNDKQIKAFADIAINKLEQLTRDKFLLEQIDSQPKADQASIFLSSNFVTECSLEERKDIARELVVKSTKTEQSDLLYSLLSKNTELETDVLSKLFKSLSSEQQEEILNSNFSDAFGFTHDSLVQTMADGPWKWHWELDNEKNGQYVFKENPKRTNLLLTDPDRDLQDTEWPWTIRLRWVVHLGGAENRHDLLPIPWGNNKEQCLGANPHFRGWFGPYTNAGEARMIGLYKQ